MLLRAHISFRAFVHSDHSPNHDLDEPEQQPGKLSYHDFSCPSTYISGFAATFPVVMLKILS